MKPPLNAAASLRGWIDLRGSGCRSAGRHNASRAAVPRVLDRGGSDTRTGERHMRDSGGRGGGLDLVVLLEALQPVPEAYASAEQNRDHHQVRVVDEPGGKEVADHGGTPAEAYVLAVRGLAGGFERLRG